MGTPSTMRCLFGFQVYPLPSVCSGCIGGGVLGGWGDCLVLSVMDPVHGGRGENGGVLHIVVTGSPDMLPRVEVR